MKNGPLAGARGWSPFGQISIPIFARKFSVDLVGVRRKKGTTGQGGKFLVAIDQTLDYRTVGRPHPQVRSAQFRGASQEHFGRRPRGMRFLEKKDLSCGQKELAQATLDPPSCGVSRSEPLQGSEAIRGDSPKREIDTDGRNIEGYKHLPHKYPKLMRELASLKSRLPLSHRNFVVLREFFERFL